MSSPICGGSYPHKRSGIIYPTVSINKVRVGLMFLAYLPRRRRGATTGVGSCGRSIDGRRSRGAADHQIKSEPRAKLNYYNGFDR